MRRLLISVLLLSSAIGAHAGRVARTTSWPTGPVPINAFDALAPQLATYIPQSSTDWVDMVSGNHAQAANNWNLQLGGCSSGSFTLTFNGQTTISCACGISAATLKTNITNLNNVLGAQGVNAVTGGFSIGIDPTIGLNGTLTWTDSLVGASGQALTQSFGTVAPASIVTNDGSWRWGPAFVADNSVTNASTMKMAVKAKMFSVQPVTGWSELWISSPNFADANFSYQGDLDIADPFALYWNNPGKPGQFGISIRNDANTPTTTYIPNTAFGASPGWCFVVKTMGYDPSGNYRCHIYANFTEAGLFKPYLVQQTTAEAVLPQTDTTTGLTQSWGGGGKFIFLNGQGPICQGNRFKGQIATLMTWGRVLSRSEADRLYRDPWCFLSTHGSLFLPIFPVLLVGRRRGRRLTDYLETETDTEQRWAA